MPTTLIGEPVRSIPDHKVTAADGTKVEVKPVVVEAKDLIASSDEGYEASLQPRQRERAASQAQIREIATRLEPERLGYSAEADRGAPIVGPDGMVESGNGRVQAIRAVYKYNPTNAKRYRDWLQEQGVDVAKFKEPVLVRQRVTELTPQERRDLPITVPQTTEGLAAITRLRREEIDGFVDGLFGSEERIDLPERGYRALEVLGEIRAMLAGVCELANSPDEATGGEDVTGLLANINELTKIVELELHEAVLACARARRQMSHAMPVTKPVFH